MTCSNLGRPGARCYTQDPCDPCAPKLYNLQNNDLNRTSWLVDRRECPKAGNILAPTNMLTVNLFNPDYVQARMAVASQAFSPLFFVRNNGWGVVKAVRPFRQNTQALGMTLMVCELYTVGEKFSLADVDPTLVQAWSQIGPFGAFVGLIPGVPSAQDPVGQIPVGGNVGTQIPAFRVNSLDAQDNNTPAFVVGFEIADMVLNNAVGGFAEQRSGSGRVVQFV